MDMTGISRLVYVIFGCAKIMAFYNFVFSIKVIHLLWLLSRYRTTLADASVLRRRSQLGRDSRSRKDPRWWNV